MSRERESGRGTGLPPVIGQLTDRLGDRTGATLIPEPYPRAVWSPYATAAVLVIVLLTIEGALLIEPGASSIEQVARTTQLVVFPVIALGGLMLSFQHRISDDAEVAWISVCLIAYAVPGMVLAGLRVADNHLSVREPGWILVVHLPLAMAMLVAVRRADRTPLRVDPIGVGFGVGLLVAAACVVAYHLAPGAATSRQWVMATASVGLFVTCVGLAVAVRRLVVLPPWCRDRMALGTMLLLVNHLSISLPAGTASSLIAIVTGVLGAVVMLDVAVALLRSAVIDQHGVVVDLAGRVAVMEAGDRESQARLHELTNSIAGIAVASSLIHGDTPISAEQRQRLEEMLESESHRLARVLGGDRLAEAAHDVDEQPAVPEVAILDVDEVIRPIVTSHLALRRPVRWQPSGQIAHGDADAVSEVINILVDNAARHAPDSEIDVAVSRVADSVEIAVHDNGPGIPDEVRRQRYEWGGRGPESHGKGIGLFLAHQLMATDGHSLRLDMNATGTTFVIELPLVRN